MDSHTCNEDWSELLVACRVELKRVGERWDSDRTLDFIEKLTGKRNQYYLNAAHLKFLLGKLQSLPNLPTPALIKDGTQVRLLGSNIVGTVRLWDADIESWLVEVNGRVEPFDTEELEVVA